jgi:DnaJ-class molecular chaperone
MKQASLKKERRPRAGRPMQGQENPDGTVDLMCAFCGGSGRDPFGLMSPLSTCQVCGGTGRNRLRGPAAACPFCNGTGVNPGLRQTCLACGGTGYIQVPVEASACPCCGGSGRASDYLWPDSPLTCSCCGGSGLVMAGRAAGLKPRERGKNE